MKIIGSKGSFGIEYQVNSITNAGPFGTICLWLGGTRFGDDCGDIFLMPTANRLRFFVEKKHALIWPSVNYPTSISELCALTENEALTDLWMFYTAGFDDFIGLLFYENGFFNIFFAKIGGREPSETLNTVRIVESVFANTILQFCTDVCKG